MAEHGTSSRYNDGGCRCGACRAAIREYQERRRRQVAAGEPRMSRQEELLGKLLDELFPFGLTDDCPARRERTAA